MHVLEQVPAHRRLFECASDHGNDDEQQQGALIVEMDDGSEARHRLDPMGACVAPVEPGAFRRRGREHARGRRECPGLPRALLVVFHLPTGGVRSLGQVPRGGSDGPNHTKVIDE